MSIVDTWTRELRKEREVVKSLQERMDKETSETSLKRELRRSQEAHKREIEQLERSLQGHGVDIKNLPTQGLEANPSERLGMGETVNDLLPMPPDQGPPLPRGLNIKWPGRRG